MYRRAGQPSAEAEDADEIHDFRRRQRRNVRRSHAASVVITQMLVENPVMRMVQRGVNQIRDRMTEKPKTHKIAVEDLLKVAVDMDRRMLKAEFESLPNDYTRTYGASRSSGNFSKNLYHDIYPYDDNRVVFVQEGNPGSGYINASYINGYHKEKKYIAAQCPSKTTKVDFWKMVWDNSVNFIVMLNSAKDSECVDADVYLPDPGGEEAYGKAYVTNKASIVYADFVISSLEIRVGEFTNPVTHLHFTSWPGDTVPSSPTELIEFHQRYRAMACDDISPTVVHCSAGVGRTGVFIALDLLTDEGLATGNVDVLQCVTQMRHQRVHMVQTRDQYEFLYKLIAQTLALDCRLIHRHDFAEYWRGMQEKRDDGTTRLEQKFQNLLNSVMLDEFEIAALEFDQEKRNKDRPTSEIPNPKYRPVLGGVYINAVFVDSYRKKDDMVLTQMPTTVTIQDFCRLVTDEGCSVVVMLNPIDPDDKYSGIYWPEKDGTVKIGNSFTVTNLKEEQTSTYIDRTLKFDYKKNKADASLEVRMLQYTAWPKTDVLPDVTLLLEVVEMARDELAKHPGNRLLVHCLNGTDQSGLYCVVQDLVGRLQTEEQICVIHSIRKLKSRRPMSIQSQDQLKFCYQAVDTYLKASPVKDGNLI